MSSSDLQKVEVGRSRLELVVGGGEVFAPHTPPRTRDSLTGCMYFKIAQV